MEFNTSDEILIYFKQKCIEYAILNPPLFSGDEKHRDSEVAGGAFYYSNICQSELLSLKDDAPHGVLVDILELNLSSILFSLYNQYVVNYTTLGNVSAKDFR